MGKGSGVTKREKIGPVALALDDPGAIHSEQLVTASAFVALDRAYSTGRDKKSPYVELEHVLLPDDAVETGDNSQHWRVDFPYTKPGLRGVAGPAAQGPVEVRLGGLTLAGADLLRPGAAGPQAEIPEGYWGYLPNVEFDPKTSQGRIASCLFSDGAQAHFDVTTRRATCQCNGYDGLRICPHQALMFMGYCANLSAATGKQTSLQGAGKGANLQNQLKQRWNVWLNTTRGQETEGLMLVKLVDAFHTYLNANPDLDFTVDSKPLDEEIRGFIEAIQKERARREGGGVVDDEGDFRIPAIDERFAGISTAAEYSDEDRASLVPYPRDLVLTRNMDRALFTVANRLQAGVGYAFGFYGPKGTGKDTCARAIATALRRPVFTFDCDAATNFSWAMGGTNLVENVDEKEVETVEDGHKVKRVVKSKVGGSHLAVTLGGLGQAFMRGYVVIIDEIIAADPSMRTALHMAFQDRVFVLKDPVAGVKRYPVHPDTVIICTWNPATDGKQAQMPGEALTDRLSTISFDPEPAEEVAKKLAKYLNERYASGTDVAFEDSDCLPVANLIQTTLPRMAASGTRLLKRTPSYRTATKLVDQLVFIGKAGWRVAEHADYAIDPLLYLVDQPDGKPEVKQAGVKAIEKEFTSGEEWDTSPLLQKIAQLRIGAPAVAAPVAPTVPKSKKS